MVFLSQSTITRSKHFKCIDGNKENDIETGKQETFGKFSIDGGPIEIIAKNSISEVVFSKVYKWSDLYDMKYKVVIEESP